MNQILSVENKKKGKNKGPVEIKKVTRFFAIVILLFGFLLMGKGSYAIVKNMNLIPNQNQDVKPTIDLVKEQDKMISFKATYKRELVKIVYQWNDGEEKEIPGNGSNVIEGNIELPVGQNVLNIKIVDIRGQETSYKKEYTVDAEKPQLAIGAEDGKVKIIAKDMVALSYITYRWDDQEEKKVEPKEDSKAQIEITIDTLKGKHDLTVVAVNSNNLSETVTRGITGATEPKTWAEQDKDIIYIHATDEDGVNIIDIVLNGKKYKVDYTTQPSKEIVLPLRLQQGENRISIKAYNIYNVEATFEGICSYTP